jgi:hypothetical protein
VTADGAFLVVHLELTRQAGPVLLNTVLPTLVLTAINQLTNYWGDCGQMFEAVVGITATVLMTLAAMFISYFQSLPSSAAIRCSRRYQDNLQRKFSMSSS